MYSKLKHSSKLVENWEMEDSLRQLYLNRPNSVKRNISNGYDEAPRFNHKRFNIWTVGAQPSGGRSKFSSFHKDNKASKPTKLSLQKSVLVRRKGKSRYASKARKSNSNSKSHSKSGKHLNKNKLSGSSNFVGGYLAPHSPISYGLSPTNASPYVE